MHTNIINRLNIFGSLVKRKDFCPNNGRAWTQRHHVLHNWFVLALHRDHACNLNDWVQGCIWEVALQAIRGISIGLGVCRKRDNKQSCSFWDGFQDDRVQGGIWEVALQGRIRISILGVCFLQQEIILEKLIFGRDLRKKYRKASGKWPCRKGSNKECAEKRQIKLLGFKMTGSTDANNKIN